MKSTKKSAWVYWEREYNAIDPVVREKMAAGALRVLSAEPERWCWVDERVGMMLVRRGLAVWQGPKGERCFKLRGVPKKP